MDGGNALYCTQYPICVLYIYTIQFDIVMYRGNCYCFFFLLRNYRLQNVPMQQVHKQLFKVEFCFSIVVFLINILLYLYIIIHIWHIYICLHHTCFESFFHVFVSFSCPYATISNILHHTYLIPIPYYKYAFQLFWLLY